MRRRAFISGWAVGLALLVAWAGGAWAQEESGAALPEKGLEDPPIGAGAAGAGTLLPMPPPVVGPSLYQPENLDLNLDLLRDLAPDLWQAREIQRHAQDLVATAEVFQRLGAEDQAKLGALTEAERNQVVRSEQAGDAPSLRNPKSEIRNGSAAVRSALIGHVDMARQYEEQLPQKAAAEFQRAAELAQKALEEATEIVQTTEAEWSQAQSTQAQAPGDPALWNKALEAHRKRTWAPSVVPLARSLLGDIYGDLGRLHLHYLQLKHAEYDFRMVLYYMPPKDLLSSRKPTRPAWLLTEETSAEPQAYGSAAEVGLGFCYLLRRDFRNANRYFRRALLHRPPAYASLPLAYRDYCSSARFGLGAALWDAGFYQDAVTELKRALAEGLSVEKYADLARHVIAAFAGRSPVRYLPPPLAFHELLVNHTMPAGGPGVQLPVQKDVVALEHFRQALSLRQSENDVEGAMAEYRQALAARPDFVEARVNLAALLELQGEYAQSIQEYETVLKQRPVFPEAHYALAAVLDRIGRPHEARQHLAMALEQGLSGASARQAEAILTAALGGE